MENKRKKILGSILIIMLITIVGVVMYYWFASVYYVSTEDAKVEGDFVKISPVTSGKILELSFDEGQKVVESQILGRLDSANAIDSAIEQSLVRCPINGVIIKKQANVGELATAGQTIGYVVDPQKLYITANIEETKIDKIKVGQEVDITIDQHEGAAVKGKIRSIGKASTSAFSLLPSSSSGSFTKVVQRIPVKIEIDSTDLELTVGTNVGIKIHIK